MDDARPLGALQTSCPPDLRVLFAPCDVALADDTVVQPDLLVARRDAFTAQDLPHAPMLAVEVLSPSTRRIDLHLKRARYEAAGCPSYWVVDPAEPSVTVWELREGSYVETGRAVAGERITVTLPFVLDLRPSDLLD